MPIYTNQTSLRFILKTNVDFNVYGVSSSAIKFREPDGTEGEFTAAVLSGSESEGKIYVDFDSDNNFDQHGIYVVWAYITYTAGGVAPGTPIEIQVYEEGLNN